MKKMKRSVSLLLVFVMVVGLLPMSAFEAFAAGTEDTVYVIAGSDYQGHEAADNEANTGTARGVVTNKILNELASCGIKPDGVLFCGDYTRYGLSSNTANNQSDVKRGIDQLKSLTTSVLGVKESEVDWVFTQGNHDRDATTAHGLSKGGANDTEHYGVYVLHNNDYGWTADGNMAGDLNAIKAEAKEMKAYFDAKIKEGYTKPIFIAAHIPLHYSYRTRMYEDAKNARYIFNVINEAGAAGLNIIYLFGHNHSAPSDSYIGGGAAYLGRGDTIFVSKIYDVNAKPSELTLNFTYMNCGYLSYTSNVNTDGSTPSMAVFAITGDKVEIKRYCYHGLLALKARGKLASFAESTGTVTETYETYGVTEAEMNAYLNTRFKSTVIEPASTTNMGETIQMPIFGTRYYQVDTFKEGQFFAIANYGDGEGQYQVLRTTNNDGGVGVRNVTFKKDAKGRIYFEPFATDDENKAIQWIWEGYAPSENGTVGSLKNRLYSRYLQMTDDGSGFALVAGVKGLRTTSSKHADDTKMYWRFDNKDRTSGAFKGYPSGVFVHSHNELNVVANRYYVLRNGSSNGWSAGGSGSPTGDNGPTYIFKRFTDYITGYDTAVATGPAEYTLITGQYASWDKLKAKIMSDLTVKVNGTATTNFTLSSTADPTTVGEYVAYVNYNGYTLGTIKIHVADPAITQAVVIPDVGTVYQGVGTGTKTGSVLTVKYENGVVVEVPVTVGMLRDASGNAVSTGKRGTLENLKVVYKDATVSGYTLRVLDKNYPEYPAPGSVKVEKIGTGIEFDDTGMAQVDLSATGVPLRTGIDVIVMVDTSSSMGPQGTETKAQSRLAQTHKAINNLIATLKEHVNDGTLGETKIAIADFNAYKKASDGSDYANQPWGYYALDGNCWVRDPGNPGNTGLHYATNTANTHGARTGVTDPLDLSANAFVDVTDMSSSWANDTTLGIQNGTNYDFAFDAIYQLGHSIQKHNKEQGLDDRELIVIFMSDGCPFQYNYFMSHAENNIWNHWLNGTLNDAGLKALTGGTPENPSLWEHFYNSNQGRHWMAEAIKGDPNQRYKVIRKSDTNLEDVIELNTAPGTNQYAGTLPGLGAQMYSIALGINNADGKINLNTILGVLERIASKPSNFYNVPDQSELDSVFNSIATTVVRAATQSYFLDTMGDAYDLYMSDKVFKSDGTVLEGVVPAIEVRDYAVTDFVRSTEPDKVLERITFGGDYRNAADDTTMTVYQDLLNDDGTYTRKTINIKMGDLLKGKYVYYNTSKTKSQTVTYYGKTITLEPETFFYITDTLVADKAFALNYYVYLEDALDDNGDNEAVGSGTYPTNESATLYYKNYRSYDCTKDTVSPELPWDVPKVNYGFYLVDPDGNIVSDQKTGATTTDFSERTEVIPSTLFEKFQFNTTSSAVMSHELIGQLAELGYELYVYDEETGKGVTYSVEANSGNGGGSWTIEGDNTGSTYVTGYDGDKYSKITESEDLGDYTNTTVWFAIVAKVKIVPDVIVVDFGLPVEFDVMQNDIMIGTAGVLSGLGVNAPANMRPIGTNQSLEQNFAMTLNRDSAGLKYGSAKIENGKVVYSLETMEMKDAEVFYYGLQYSGTVGAQGYYYAQITVIPATTIYYEDSFVNLQVWNTDLTPSTEAWETTREEDDITQAQDRPGDYIFDDLDADNIYGYDSAYAGYKTTANSGHAITVDKDTFATATFTFWGTGFDVLAASSKYTGAISVDIYDADVFAAQGFTAPTLKTYFVDTYLGYTFENGEWVPTNNGPSALYHVPVITVEDLQYGRYTAVITAAYSSAFDHLDKGSYRFYLDAIRIYDPANDGADSEVIKNAYVADKEGWPDYHELRNMLIGTNDFTSSAENGVEGIVFIDGNDKLTDDNASRKNPLTGKANAISDYANFGPNNELYLGPGQGVTFKLNATGDVAAIHLAMKGTRANDNKIKVYDAAVETVESATERIINTSVDMYYDITALNGKTVVIYNSGKTNISITNIKITYNSYHEDVFGSGGNRQLGLS